MSLDTILNSEAERVMKKYPHLEKMSILSAFIALQESGTWPEGMGEDKDNSPSWATNAAITNVKGEPKP